MFLQTGTDRCFTSSGNNLSYLFFSLTENVTLIMLVMYLLNSCVCARIDIYIIPRVLKRFVFGSSLTESVIIMLVNFIKFISS